MSVAQAKPKPSARRHHSPTRNLHRMESPAGGFAAPVANRSLGAFYGAGPALSLGGVQMKSADEEPLTQTAVQLCPCEEEGSGTVEPPRVQQQTEDDDPDEGADPTQMVQLWDCDEYSKPTCVQSKCAECEAEEAAEDETPVQEKCAECEAEEEVQQAGGRGRSPQRSPRLIQREARRGLRDASHSLPHGERIQSSFGRHDLSHVRTSIGGDARAANRRMGALAFTSGDRIGFRESPSLHLAAHEAAHVVQQRAGLRLPGNVGRAGDPWERHADRVADVVVDGRSAEGLLDEVAAPAPSSSEHADGGAMGASAVQQQITSGATRLFEPPVVPELPEPSPAEEEVPPSEAAPAEAEASEASEEAAAMEAAQEGESEAPPEGVPAEGAGSAGAGEPAGEAGAGGEEGGAQGGGLNTPCYNVDPPPPPDNAPDPSSDERSSQSEEESKVTFDPWPDEADECDANKVVAEGEGQMPEGIGSGESAAPMGELVMAESVSTVAASQNGASGGEGAPASGSPEVQTMSRAADEGADQLESAASSMDGQIASAEGERDTAVGDYATATGGLGSLVARSQSLAAGVSFPAAKGAQQAEARQTAIAQTRDFMARAADQIAAAVAFAQDQLPSMLRDVAESTQATIQDAIETEKAAISDRIAQTRAQARAGAAAARAHVNAEYAASAAQIEASTLSAITALDDTHATSLELVDEKETDGLDDVNGRFADGRTDHEAKGPEYADRAIARGQEHVDEYERCKRHPETGVNYDDDGFWDGCLTVRRAKAQQDAACKTAASFKDGFLRKANKKGYDLIALRRQYRCAVISGAGKVTQTLNDTHDQLVSGLESGRMQALDGIALARDENLAAIDNALAATLRSLAAQETTQRQAVNDTGYLKQLAVEQLAHASAASLAQGISAAMDSLEETLATLVAGFADGELPDPALLAESLGVTETSLGGGMGMLLDTMAEGAGQAQSRIEESGSAALEALSLIRGQNDDLCAQAESGFAGQMGNLRVGASNTFSQLTENHVQQAERAMTEGTSSMEQAVAGFDEALSTIGGHVDEAIATSLRELDQDLGQDLAKLDGKIASEAWKAAKKEQPAWKSVVAIILVIVVIIAAALISIATLGAGASLFAVILVGALVGAVSGGLIQIINNWASGEAWHTGLAQAMIMGAIGGAIGGGLGFAGGALAAGAAQAGARVVTQLAITVGADLVAEGLTQTIGYVAFGQEFNWQGFVTAGAMSGVSFRAQPRGARPGAPRPDVPTPSAAGAAGGRRAAVAQIAGGAAVGFGVEAATAAISGKEFDPTKAFSAAASGAVGARMSRRGGAAGPAVEPTTRLGRAADRFRSFDPGGVGARLESRLQGIGGRLVGGAPETGAPAVRPPGVEEGGAPSRLPREEAPEPAVRRSTHDDAVEIEPGIVARREFPGDHAVTVRKDGRIFVCSECAEIRLRFATELSDPLNAAHVRELNRIEAIADPQAKLEASIRLRNSLEVLRSSGISRPPAGADGTEIARAAGLPDAPTGYQWVRTGRGVDIVATQPDLPRIRFDDATGGFVRSPEPGEFGTALRTQVGTDAAEIIAAATSKRELQRLAATSRAGVPDLDIRTLHSFENLRANIADFPGVRHVGDTFTITNPDAFMVRIRALYEASGHPLHPATEQLILNHVRSAVSFDTHAGLPGLHAEVRAVNDIFHTLTARGYDVSNFDLGRLQVATYKVAPGFGQGGEFGACRNCGSILPPLINILTGRRFE